MTSFNIRIYGLLIQENKLLIIREPFAGKMIDKFPGGGLEFGEGTRDCLKREFMEELNLQINVKEHFYTQDNFIASRFNENEQLLMIYYKVEAVDLAQLKIVDADIEKLIWKDFNELSTNDLSLESDQLVVKMLLEN